VLLYVQTIYDEKDIIEFGYSREWSNYNIIRRIPGGAACYFPGDMVQLLRTIEKHVELNSFRMKIAVFPRKLQMAAVSCHKMENICEIEIICHINS